MTKLHEIEILNSLLDEFAVACNHCTQCENFNAVMKNRDRADEIRAKIVTVANRLIALRTRDL